jgi:hypothetical protein
MRCKPVREDFNMPAKKITQSLRKILIVSISLLSVALIGCTDQSGNHANPSLFVKDSASSDTPVETLKTLTADISAVKQQNQQLAAQNKLLMQQNKTSVEQFKKDMQLEVDQQITRAKTDLQQSALELNINITQEIPIDYHPLGRKVFYDHDNQSNAKNGLD